MLANTAVELFYSILFKAAAAAAFTRGFLESRKMY